ncbi:hypothetical protein [Mycobacterium sp.]|uniref:hypothetical protein n=1 Tax=Mycobacterium sp. TaxID=1785 RepID=UPI002D8A2B9A|nr:hypothetical protein [Mycobacterium sp.]
MVTVAFRDSAGRPVVDAIVSIASAPGEIRDIGMVTDERGEISIATSGMGDYEFVVFRAGNAQNVRTHIAREDERLTLVLN